MSPGIGVGSVVRLADRVPEPPSDAPAGDPVVAWAQASDALAAVAADLEERGRRARPEARAVLEAQALMARDPDLAAEVARRVAAGSSAARAVYDAFGTHRTTVAAAGCHVAGRVADLDDVCHRTMAWLSGTPPPDLPTLTEPAVLVARDLAPADTALLDRTKVVAFATEEGGPTSHTAILARALGVPAVVACQDVTALPEGVTVMVDGGSGVVRADPTTEDLAAVRGTGVRGVTGAATTGSAAATGLGQGRTADGDPVELLANLGSPADVASALAHGAEGVGLFRTEFCFLDRSVPPSEQEQAALYRQVLGAFGGRRVVARVLDAGADKPLRFLPLKRREPNPALGLRGIRLLRQYPELLAGQLRALAETAADTGADLQVMAPMVADLDDTQWFVTACRDVGLVGPVGVMIEVPAAALRAAELAANVDFLSVGTNDMTQYAFAADRAAGAVARFQDPWQPALLDLVACVAAAAGAAGIPCGVCGEAAADPALACVLVGLGVTSLSMDSGTLPAVRAALATHTAAVCRAAAAAARAATSPTEARGTARDALSGAGTCPPATRDADPGEWPSADGSVA
ncbi:MAG: phosphoenolpyruvate--protein phosphotransferase [Pseudonocardiaceae bacterium]